jgi:hypothetical protein
MARGNYVAAMERRHNRSLEVLGKAEKLAKFKNGSAVRKRPPANKDLSTPAVNGTGGYHVTNRSGKNG